MGCILGPILSMPVAFFYWVRENGVKGYIVAAFLILGTLVSLILVQGAINNALNPYSPSLEEQAEFIPPPRAEAPYRVITTTRIYYAMIAIVNDDNTVTMTSYYEWLNGEWTRSPGVLVLDKYYGEVTVEKRRLGE